MTTTTIDKNPLVLFIFGMAQYMAPQIGEAPPTDLSEFPAEEASDIEKAIRMMLPVMGPVSADECVKRFLDMAYTGMFEDLSPQFPREVFESALAKVKAEKPELWLGAAKHFGLPV